MIEIYKDLHLYIKPFIKKNISDIQDYLYLILFNEINYSESIHDQINYLYRNILKIYIKYLIIDKEFCESINIGYNKYLEYKSVDINAWVAECCERDSDDYYGPYGVGTVNDFRFELNNYYIYYLLHNKIKSDL